MKIVVTTPTGNVGSYLVRALVRAGVRPTVFLRHPGKLEPAVREHVDVAEGDQLDADHVLAATEGADALYWVAPPTGAEDPLAAHGKLAENVSEAVVRHGIGRTVFQSSVGAEKRSGAGEIDGLAAIEEALDATGAPVLHLRCGMFFTNLLLDAEGLEEGVLRVTWPIDLPLAWVDPRDVAEVAAARLLAGGWTGREVQGVHGPEDLSYEQVAATVATATGRSLRAERVPDDAMRQALLGAGLGEKQVDAIVGMSVGLREGFIPEQERSLITTTPSTLAAWAYERLRPVLGGS